MVFYAVAKGHNVGIYTAWNDCKEQVLGFKGAVHKKFSTESEAENFILNCNNCNSEIHKNIFSKFVDNKIAYYVYTDGSCYNNGRENSIAGIGIYFDENNSKNVSKVLTDNYKHSNNSAELTAIIETIEIIENDLIEKHICIVTDSDYSIKCATSYGDRCEKNNWKMAIPNKILVKKLYELYNKHKNLKLKHIKAHTNLKDVHSIGNSNADKLAYNALRIYIDNNIDNK
jgi:ribonuclease HI